ncbi:MAG: amidohydrolase family protein [Candidatus Aminicenantes bacterium]|nr:amidohydrolase family protein [Candidatus Aminicenantes bacterium]
MNRAHFFFLGFVAILCIWNPGVLPAEQVSKTIDVGMLRPSLSPDGKLIAFEWMSSIWTVPVEGGTAVQLSDWSMRRAAPVWSPDCKHIACIATDKDVRTFSVQVLDLEKKSQPGELWRTDREIKPSLDWSPDGKQLVFSLDSDQNIHVLALEGAALQPLGIKGMHPRWSPEGKRLAYQTQDNRDLWVVAMENGKKRRLVTTVSFNGSFCWSADGEEIVYESLDRGSVDLWRVAIAGGRATPLTDDIALEQTPRWHPSDGHIYFSHRRRLWRVPFSGGRMEMIPIQCRLPEKIGGQKASAFVGADVIDVSSGEKLPDQTVLVRDGRIEAIGSGIPLPKDAEVFDVCGLTVIPGLIDMHVHYQPWMGPYFLRYGISRIQEMGCGDGPDVILAQGEEIKYGLASGPVIYQCGMIFNGSGVPGPPGLGGIQTENQEVLRQALEWHIGEGVDFIKIGSENSRESLRTILEVAHARNLRVIGHIALVPVHDAIDMGQDGIEHPRGLGWGSIPPAHQPDPVPRRLQGMLREASAWWNPDHDRVSAIVDHMIAKNVVWDPTLYIWILTSNPEGLKGESEFGGLPEWIKAAEELGNEYGFAGTWQDSDYKAYGAGIANMRNMVGEYHRKGGLLTAGSDGGIPGKSLHQELNQLRLSGLSPLECLRAATINAARALKLESEIGSLEKGKKADLLFVKGNPLSDLSVLQNVMITVQEGRVVFKR